ncbi:MAG: hypothetical protein AMQ22_00390 [Candidatus Methanofastidiosum methylothiophilum]|uniref:Uncharacterized protein n=1 Tax=Candidatus Methanofastidiosum methylothiophilum TaxID=1705564 RepID=A0A150J7L5_9EURY|nr:MAG: hypothetical protein AMQ22_00390 [Candidatus Methanofastidiosum methylthiophilus]
MNDRYILYALAFSFIFVSAFVLLSFSEVKISEDKFTRLYFNTTILENDNNVSYLGSTELKIKNGAITIGGLDSYHPGDSFFVDDKRYTLNMITKDSLLLYNYTKKTDGLVYFDFTIENFEGADKNYSFVVFIDGNKIMEGNESIKSNEKKTIQKAIDYKEPGDHRLSVKLNTGAEIYFNFSSVKK